MHNINNQTLLDENKKEEWNIVVQKVFDYQEVELEYGWWDKVLLEHIHPKKLKVNVLEIEEHEQHLEGVGVFSRPLHFAEGFLHMWDDEEPL